MPSPELKWIEMVDFGEGIFSNNNLAGGINVTSDNPCKAQEAGTYRCISLPTGGLGPLPRRTEDFGLSTNPGPAATDITVSGMSTWGRVRPTTPADVDNSSRYEVHLNLYWEEPDGGGAFDLSYAWVRENQFVTAKGTEIISTGTELGVITNLPRFSYFSKTRLNTATPTSPGVPVMVLVGLLVGSDLLPVSLSFPSSITPATNSTEQIGTLNDPYVIGVGHQGRIVLAKRIDYDHGQDALLDSDENLVWTAVNDNTLSSATPAVFVPEVDAYITDMCSMSANQLFVIKTIGGGYVLQGDLDDVTVLRLPNLMCPDGAPTVRGTNTAKGFVYSAGYNGLYIWNGGDQATQISQQLDGEAFIAGQGTTNRGHGGQCDRWMNLIIAPRNWVWQSEENRQGWWRLENPDDLLIRLWSTTADASRLVGVESTFQDDDLFMHQWDYNDLAYSWSWKSHPLWISRDKYMEVRQGVIALQGTGSVTVTLIDEEGNESPKTIAVDSTTIANYRWDIGSDAQNLIVQIEAEGTLDDVTGLPIAEAPLVHRMFLGYREAQHLRNSGA